MSLLRDLATGSDNCTPDGAGPSNAVGSLVNTLLGASSKAQEHLRELPHVQQVGGMPGASSGLITPGAAAAAAAAHAEGFRVPGMGPMLHTGGSSNAHAFMESLMRPTPAMGHHAAPQEWDRIFGGAGEQVGGLVQSAPQGLIQGLGPPPSLIAGGEAPTQLTHFFKAFVSGATARPLVAPMPPLAGDASAASAALSVGERCRIRDRSTILARHMFADQGPAFADQQVVHLLASLQINPTSLPVQLPHVHDTSWHGVWDEERARAAGEMRAEGGGRMLAEEFAAGAQQAAWDGVWGAAPRSRPMSTGWASEFIGQQGMAPGTSPMQHLPAPSGASSAAAWAEEFSSRGAPGEAWAGEFEAAAATGLEELAHGKSSTPAEAMQSTRALADLLSKDSNPKMHNSKFLKFVSKLSRGEILFEDNKVVDRAVSGAAWADKFKGASASGAAGWADEFKGAASTSGAAGWADEFSHHLTQRSALPPHHSLAAPSGTRPAGGDWADEFARGVADLKLDSEGMEAAWGEGGGGGARTWVDEFQGGEEAVYEEWERLYGHGNFDSVAGGQTGVRGEYVFTPGNPFLGDPEALAKGKDLFRRGVLTEAALALEAEVQARPDNAEAWRLLGTVQAENDDDQQAIAAMSRALKSDPNNMDVLLSLGVSHTNELDTGEAVSYLTRWLSSHPLYGASLSEMGPPPDSSQVLSHTVRMFQMASSRHPDEAELHAAVGVLLHLGRHFGAAIEAFERSLKLRPGDYSLWNKLGATLANNARSSEAVYAYQRALDIKPNYMRAWTNMGISFSNLGEYEKSARFYVRALGLNQGAHHVWGYLRTALACAGRADLVAAVDAKDLGALAQKLPLMLGDA